MGSVQGTWDGSRRRRLRNTLVVSALAISAACAVPSGAASGRITGPIDPARVAVATGSVHPLARPEDDQGRLDGATVLPGITLAFAPSAEQAADLTTLLAEQQDMASPRYHGWLTPEEYGQRFGMSRGDLSKVVGWLEGAGFTVLRIARSASEMTVSGTAAQVEAAFHTEMHRYRTDGGAHFGMSREPSLPEALAGVVVGLRGLDDFEPRPRRPDYTLAGEHHVSPEDFATIYDVEKLYASGIDGTGMTIAITGQTFYTPLDVSTFRTMMGLPVLPPPQNIPVPNSGTSTFIDPTTIGEAELDLELSGAVARNATIVFVYTAGAAGYSIRDALQYAVDNKVADIVSISAGYCPGQLAAAAVTMLETVGNQANAEGVTILAGSGDSGPAGCDLGANVATRGISVDLPAGLPQVTGVGGTDLDEGAGTYWNATNDATYGSAISYIPETSWNDVVALNGVWASGGGASTYAKPSWQVGAGVPDDLLRDVPDVALSSGYHDGRVVYWSSPAATNGSGLYWVYGTSVAAPSFAGIVALVQQATGGGALGNINPLLYALAAQTPAAFHDVTTGNSVVPCTAGTKDCPATGQYGFSAGPGYDLVTGLGSIDAFALVNAWKACLASGCASQAVDAGAADAGGNDAGGGDSGSGGSGGGDAAVVDSGARSDSGTSDSGAPPERDAASSDAASEGSAGNGSSASAGCGCKIAGAQGGTSDTAFLVLGSPLLVFVRRRRRAVEACR